MIYLLYCLIIFILVFVLMIGVFVLMIRLGLFNMKSSSDSISWEEFKSYIKKVFKEKENEN
jgi:uncharacterized membrane protein (DUF373 family)